MECLGVPKNAAGWRKKHVFGPSALVSSLSSLYVVMYKNAMRNEMGPSICRKPAVPHCPARCGIKGFNREQTRNEESNTHAKNPLAKQAVRKQRKNRKQTRINRQCLLDSWIAACTCVLLCLGLLVCHVVRCQCLMIRGEGVVSGVLYDVGAAVLASWCVATFHDCVCE